jgi:chemotaxis protein MotB
VTEEGLRIELLEKDQSSFFDTGSAVLRGESVRILGLIGHELAQLTNDIVVEGHTDARPFGAGSTYSNWELSADRANAARRVMEAVGLNPGQVQGVRGFAATQLRLPEAPMDSRNRRISIVVRSQSYTRREQELRDSSVGAAADAPAAGEAPATTPEPAATPVARPSGAVHD